MRLFRCQLDAKSRRIYAAGNLCLFSGLAITLFAGGFNHRYAAVSLGLRFLLMGAAICLLFWSARRAGGCAAR